MAGVFIIMVSQGVGLRAQGVGLHFQRSNHVKAVKSVEKPQPSTHKPRAPPASPFPKASKPRG